MVCPSQSAKISAIGHLARAVSGISYNPESLFAMFTCYFDEAGGKDHGFTVVAGWAASVERWEHFELDWKLFLIKWGVPHLHMKEFTQSVKAFKGWDGPNMKTRRDVFMMEAAEIVRHRAARSFICVVDHKSFEDGCAKYPIKSYAASPYALAGRTCVAFANKWRKGIGTSNDLEYVFDQGGPDVGGLVESISKKPRRLPIPIFKPSRELNNGLNVRPLVQLQSADFLAYEIRKWHTDRPDLKSPQVKPRESLRALLSFPDIDIKLYGKASIERLGQKIVDYRLQHPKAP